MELLKLLTWSESSSVADSDLKLQSCAVWLSCCGAARRPCVLLHLSCSAAQSSTAGNMRSFILVAVLLQLAAIITHTTAQYNFGDIIAFPRNCDANNKPQYIHFGIYVGGQNVPNVNQGNNDLFHLEQDEDENAICHFDRLESVRDEMREVLFNYLDNTQHYRAQANPEHIAQRIRETPEDCGKYKITRNNCEHRATLLRYNEKVCLQRGAKVEVLAALAAPPPLALWTAMGRVRCVRR
ncbi:uncharacterized protein V6R79_017954 [Siganus canaliculatus]